jgi:flagellar biosynthesis/type III secretory pathway M-ring protein FliF/YscJ
MSNIIQLIQELSKKQKIGIAGAASGLSSYTTSKISSHLMKNSDNDNLQKIGMISDKYALPYAIGTGITVAAANAYRLRKKKQKVKK